MNHRIFLGIKISGELAAEIAGFRNKNLDLPIRWSLPENLHITIIPPWYSVNMSDTIDVIQSVHYLSKQFELLFDSIIFGPDAKKPRLLWLRGNTVPELEEIKWKIEKSLKMKAKYRAFVPHITLGRFKDKIDPGIRNRFPAGVSLKESVRTITLFESFLSPKGAHYETRAVFPLG